jgi:hypothetical protein
VGEVGWVVVWASASGDEASSSAKAAVIVVFIGLLPKPEVIRDHQGKRALHRLRSWARKKPSEIINDAEQ